MNVTVRVLVCYNRLYGPTEVSAEALDFPYFHKPSKPMLGTLETQLTYIPLSEIALENDYRFRLPQPGKDQSLVQSLTKSGQTHPMVLEETRPGYFRILDGHRRFDAIVQIRTQGGSWEKMLGHIIPEGRLTPHERFHLIKERNMTGDNPWGLYEKGCFFKKFLAEGVSLQLMADECGFLPHAMEDVIELSAARPALAALINAAPLEPVYALMLHQRFEGWHQIDPGKALLIAKNVLSHAKQEKPTVKTWRFFLDFYWGKDRPFLDGRLKKN